jgi:endonuclease/exonuclease/phosphatase family metal-dependent hydrolase
VSFRLLTYNIRRGGRGRADRIARVINACAPDLVLLQEATDSATVKQLVAETGMAEGGSFRRQSLGFLSRQRVEHAAWHRPRVSHHAFIEVVPAGAAIRVFGVHLSAVHAAWTERRRVFELRALLRSIARHQDGFHVLAGDFNTLAPGALLDVKTLPLRLRPFIWMSGGAIKWRTIQTILDAKYVDAFRLKHPDDPGYTMPAAAPHVRLDYVFVPQGFADRVTACEILRHPEPAEASDHLPVVADLLTAPSNAPVK